MPPSDRRGVQELLTIKDKILKLMDVVGPEKVWLDAQLVHEYYYGSPSTMHRILGEDAWPVDFASRHEAYEYYMDLTMTSWRGGIVESSSVATVDNETNTLRF